MIKDLSGKCKELFSKKSKKMYKAPPPRKPSKIHLILKIHTNLFSGLC